MWLCLNNGFFSIVDKTGRPDALLVRARRPGDIERVFNVPATETPGRDYLYRAVVQRDDVARVLGRLALDIAYSNFKDSVVDPALHNAYFKVWNAMAALQPVAPYSRKRRMV